MSRRRHRNLRLPSLSFALLLALLALLLVAGGASRADVLGQAVVRGGAAVLLAVAALFAGPPQLRSATPVTLLLLASLALVLLQLVPLPPAMWQALPGREAFLLADQGQAVWRPIAIVPDAAVNAAAALLVPLTVLLLAAAITPSERNWLLMIVVAIAFLSMLVGMLQFSGGGIDNPLINRDDNAIAGTFANSNHFALLMALGCAVAPVWAATSGSGGVWRWPAALGAVALFELMILASGSRTGMLLGAIGLVLGALATIGPMRRRLKRFPKWVPPLALVVFIAAGGALVLASVAADRAASVDRVFSGDLQTDMRVRALPTLLDMTAAYFPAGSGFGGFDPLFRFHEPFALLKPTYFNHAHNDFIEIVLDGGIAALLLLIAGVIWWAVASVRVWRRSPSTQVLTGRAGSSILLLVLVASIVDYPARTPMIMAIIILAGLLMNWGASSEAGASLPRPRQHL